MSKSAIFAIIALITIAAFAPAGQQDGIEVLGIEVLSSGETLLHSHNPHAMAGSSAEALINFDGYTMLVDAAPVTPTGMTTLSFPAGTYGPNAAIAFIAPTGDSFDYDDIIEWE